MHVPGEILLNKEELIRAEITQLAHLPTVVGQISTLTPRRHLTATSPLGGFQWSTNQVFHHRIHCYIYLRIHIITNIIF